MSSSSYIAGNIILFSFINFQLSEDKLRTPDIWEIENKKQAVRRRLNKDEMREDKMSSWVPITESPV